MIVLVHRIFLLSISAMSADVDATVVTALKFHVQLEARGDGCFLAFHFSDLDTLLMGVEKPFWAFTRVRYE
jgi:hypothetical protein